MAQSSNKTSLLKQLKQHTKGAFKRAKKVAPVASGGRLPGDLTGAQARATGWDAEKTDKGVVIKLLMSVVKPSEYTGIPCNKRWTFNQTEYDGRVTTVAAKTAKFTNDLQLLGADLEDLSDIDEAGSSLDGIVEACKNGSVVEFNTWKSKDSDYVNIMLQRLVEVDSDVDELFEADAEEEDDEELEELAEEDEDEESEEEDEEDYEEEEEWEPVKGETILFKGPRMRGHVKCAITSVNKSKQTLSLKSPKGKTFTAVSWSDDGISLD